MGAYKKPSSQKSSTSNDRSIFYHLSMSRRPLFELSDTPFLRGQLIEALFPNTSGAGRSNLSCYDCRLASSCRQIIATQSSAGSPRKNGDAGGAWPTEYDLLISYSKSLHLDLQRFVRYLQKVNSPLQVTCFNFECTAEAVCLQDPAVYADDCTFPEIIVCHFNVDVPASFYKGWNQRERRQSPGTARRDLRNHFLAAVNRYIEYIRYATSAIIYGISSIRHRSHRNRFCGSTCVPGITTIPARCQLCWRAAIDG